MAYKDYVIPVMLRLAWSQYALRPPWRSISHIVTTTAAYRSAIKHYSDFSPLIQHESNKLAAVSPKPVATPPAVEKLSSEEAYWAGVTRTLKETLAHRPPHTQFDG